MSGEKILLISDSIEGPTGFGVNGANIAWCLAKEYEVHVLGLQSLKDTEITLKAKGDERTVIEHANVPRRGEIDFGERSLPKLLNQIKPDLLMTINDIQCVQYIPSVLYPAEIKLRILDMPSRKLRSLEELKMELEAIFDRFKEKYPPKTKWLYYCFTPDTQVLTPAGIKYITEIKAGDSVYSWNPETQKIEVTKVKDTQKIYFKGKLIGIRHKKVDFKVTPEHLFMLNNRLVPAASLANLTTGALRRFPPNRGFGFKKKKYFNFFEYFEPDYILRSEWLYKHRELIPEADRHAWRINHAENKYFMEARVGDIQNIEWYAEHDKSIYAKSSPRNQEKIPLRVDWKLFMELAGWYIAEGYLDKHNATLSGKEYTAYRVCIAQEKELGRKRIRQLLDQIGIKYTEKKRVFTIPGKFFYDLFRKLFYKDGYDARHKRIPHEFFEYEGLDRLMRGLIFGDGWWSSRGRKGGQISTASPYLRDDIIIAANLLGLRTSVWQNKQSGVYIITLSWNSAPPYLPRRL